MTCEQAGCKQSIYLFLEHHQIGNDQGQLLDFKDHPYLWDIYGDFTPKQAILKAAQIGFSTTANIKALWLAKNKGLDIIYSLPSASDIKDFVGGKTNRLIANNGIFQEWTTDKDSIEQKQLGANIIYFRGTWTERAAIAIPADLYISDETDRSKQEIVQQYKTRLQHSKYAWEWYFSNPSASGVGVDKHWQDSDQKYWFVKCSTCNNEWYITMDNIMWPLEHRVDSLECKSCLHKPYFGCLKCKEELNRRHGRWIAKFKGRPISGYWIPSLIVPTKSATDILKMKSEYTEEQFTNFVLGLPYVGKGNKLTRPMFVQNLVGEVNPRDKRTIIGVDTGIGINYVMGNEYGLFFFDKVESYEPLKRIMRGDKNAIMIIDQGGDIIGPREMREEFPNRVFLCYFRQDRKNDQLVTWNDEDKSVVADRNKMIQLVVDELIQKRLAMYGTEADWEDVWLEWAAMYRTEEESSLGTPVFKWNKGASGRCDYPFCFVYFRIGLSRYMNDKATFHTPTGESFAFRGLDVSLDGTTTFR